ncbi:MAG: alkene reductase [gamma proteobacterium symbiont of Bathyaustriella thionipta]|nr:alkene reductase [gamma proteobacterium symbiont of Bathyaustriella thionipta]MCU7950474.1 alkene reductase [gamma proteobacterium symbiont of Bathyaustriella thionipta]MCU7954660.1 alkene reductase [gamma proteobacterium symbiont of Bathyaustriella thionipta]MCU7957806.1 alkene reductase [gamma proteobacterium symbiont of Bathyaustriella thionipta]MCU7966251.1 alkene reductase [gamma proteobacterium symbiont of Bathyaustriella thionipta]
MWGSFSFKPLKIGSQILKNRILMAPLTRSRAEENHVPGRLMADYYAQRASAGLIISEATMIMQGHSAFISEPGIYSQQQINGWKQVTDAVHAKCGKIFLQLWHGGRATHPALNDGVQPVAPSPIAIDGQIHTPQGKLEYVAPRELTDAEIPAVIDGFKVAAENAMLAGFDGVEVHAANGYLLDQFLRDGSNKRNGKYGGSINNRARLLLEVLGSVCKICGSDKVGLRLSPLNGFNSMLDSDPVGLSIWLAEKLNSYNLAYLHLMRADFLQQQSGDILTPVRKHYHGVLIANMGFTADEANRGIEEGKFDAVAFGVAFLANPDLPERFNANAELNEADQDTFYSPGPEGYTDYPIMETIV